MSKLVEEKCKLLGESLTHFREQRRVVLIGALRKLIFTSASSDSYSVLAPCAQAQR